MGEFPLNSPSLGKGAGLLELQSWEALGVRTVLGTGTARSGLQRPVATGFYKGEPSPHKRSQGIRMEDHIIYDIPPSVI